MEIKKNRSPAYIGTYYPFDDPNDLSMITDLKRFLVKMNKMLKEDNYEHRFYLSIKGRLGKNSSYSHLYKGGIYQNIKILHASHVDVYIYRK